MSEHIRYIDAAQWQEAVLDSPVPVAVDFYSTECPPCDALAAKYEGLAEIWGEDVRFIKIFRQENRELAVSLGVTGSPTVLWYNAGEQVGDRLSGGIKRVDLERNLAALVPPERAEELRAKLEPTSLEVDVLIVGGGPAGLTAGIYTAQAKLKTLIVDRGMAGGYVARTHQVSNYPGFPKVQPGFMLAHYMAEQARGAGVLFREAVDITSIDLQAKEVVLDGFETVRAKRIIVATGSSPRPLGVKGEHEYQGKGLSYCATCDGKYYDGKHVIVIGGGNSAVEESLYLTRFVDKLTVVHQFDHLQANKVAQEQAFAHDKIEFVWETEPREFLHNGETVDRVVVEDLKSHERHTMTCDGVFIFAGLQANIDFLEGTVELDEWGYIRTDPEMRTSVPDVFAAGDVASKRFRQITTAVSDGTIAAMVVSKELQS